MCTHTHSSTPTHTNTYNVPMVYFSVAVFAMWPIGATWLNLSEKCVISNNVIWGESVNSSEKKFSLTLDIVSIGNSVVSSLLDDHHL